MYIFLGSAEHRQNTYFGIFMFYVLLKWYKSFAGQLSELHSYHGENNTRQTFGLRYKLIQTSLQRIQHYSGWLHHGKGKGWSGCMSVRPASQLYGNLCW